MCRQRPKAGTTAAQTNPVEGKKNNASHKAVVKVGLSAPATIYNFCFQSISPCSNMCSLTLIGPPIDNMCT